jgi:hypothetical protein
MKLTCKNGMLLVPDVFWPLSEQMARALFTVEWFATGKKCLHRSLKERDGGLKGTA